MPYNSYLAERVKQRLPHGIALTEKKMMGGLVLMVDEKMCIGVDQDRKTGADRLMVRLGKEVYDEVLQRPGCRIMDFTGKEIKGFVFVYGDGFDADTDLDFWISEALKFNKIAKKSK